CLLCKDIDGSSDSLSLMAWINSDVLAVSGIAVIGEVGLGDSVVPVQHLDQQVLEGFYLLLDTETDPVTAFENLVECGMGTLLDDRRTILEGDHIHRNLQRRTAVSTITTRGRTLKLTCPGRCKHLVSGYDVMRPRSS